MTNGVNHFNIPRRLSGLEDLAENLWWSWNPVARNLFKSLDRRIWKESVHNPDLMLRTLPFERLEEASEDPYFLRHYDLVISRFRKYVNQKGCPLLSETMGNTQPAIAYFSAEYGLHHSLPFYAGGLGFLAGDHIKECSDLNIPLVAVGFMYPEGYVSQKINQDGWQESARISLNREAASITQLLDVDRKPLVLQVPHIDVPIYIAVWKVMVGRVPLFLLDTDIDENSSQDRGISARLYVGDQEQRLRQEIVLGFGGAEVLEYLGINHSVIHLNEGHAAFALLERLRDYVDDGLSLEEAVGNVRKTTIFTTHTPVPAGHDIFPHPLLEKYLLKFWKTLGLDRVTFQQLGLHPDEPEKGFNMTAFALKLSGYKNAVSKKHGEVANRMWRNLCQGKSENGESRSAGPIGAITNGVHLPTWIEPKMLLLFNKYLGSDWLENQDDPYLWEMIHEIPDQELWQTHYWLKIKLFDDIRDRIRQRWTENHVHPSQALCGGSFLDPSILTIGFARRFTSYKRADLIFHDEERIKKLLNSRWKPIQIVFAGKAHPNDETGKSILQRIYDHARNPEFAGRVAFVENYNEQIAQYLTHGVDVWLNNPLPPMEASGTSGMKAALNGVPNLSIADGWWLEGYTGDNGWIFGEGHHPDNRDAVDAKAIYRILEEEIIPLYYNSSENGIPHGWTKVMKSAIKRVGSQFSARRMVKDYLKRFYAPALEG